jgi:hypothetical protein
MGVVLAAVASAAVAGAFCHCMCPPKLSSIPARHYEYRQRSAPIMALSLDPIPLLGQGSANRVAREEIRLFQWNEAELTNDHCSISRVALQFFRDGRWMISLRADQNPQNLESIELADGQERFIGHIKRNKFAIRLRCYTNYQVGEAAADQTTGKPVLFTLLPPEFWVQKAEPRDYIYMGQHYPVQEFFDRVDRVELEFYYR